MINEESRGDSGLEILAQALGLDPRELILLIGGPWDASVDPSSGDRETRLPGLVFVGRVGPSVVIQIHDEQVRVGRANGEWLGPHPLVWDMTDPIVTIPLDDLHGRLTEFGEAVEAACKAKRRSLKVCRYCGEFGAPEHMFDTETCYGCATFVYGVVY